MTPTDWKKDFPGALLQDDLGSLGRKVDWDKCQTCGGAFPDDDSRWRERSVKEGVVGVRHAGGCG